MNIPIIIPSYQRSNIILSKTLNFLKRIQYPENNIFVVVGCNEENQFWDYFNSINYLYPSVNILVGDNSNYKASQINFIRNELLEDNQLAILIDDDIEDLLVKEDNKLIPITKEQFEKVLCIVPNLMREYKIGLSGINNSGNAFYMNETVRLCKSCICGGFQIFFNQKDLNLTINQGVDAFESCYYLDKYEYNLKIDFITFKTKLFSVGGLYDYRQDKEQTYKDYLQVAKTYPQYLDYYTWKDGDSIGLDNKGKIVKIPKSRQDKLTIELKWKRTKSKIVRKKEDMF